MDPRPLSSGFHFAEWPWWRYLATQAGVLLHYLRLAFWPSPLVLDYGCPRALSVGQVVPQAIVLGLLLSGTAVALVAEVEEELAAGFFEDFTIVVLPRRICARPARAKISIDAAAPCWGHRRAPRPGGGAPRP